MAAAPAAIEMHTLAARLATFEGPKQLSKRRASSTKKKTPGTVSWPHKSPAPEQLAKAGFYYKPTAESSDSVSCFLCGKALDGWEEGDNPATEHLNHVPDCGWAINTCIEQRSQDADRVEEDPLSEKMMEARRATFQDQWPHEHKKGWKCKTQKMVAAGWCYSPLPEFDDCVVCFYCGTSLDGWEPKDDPWKEHMKRAPECHFFSLIEDSASLKKQTKGKKSRASKASRTSTMSAVTQASEEPSFASLNEPAGDEESMLSTTSTASKPSRGRKRAPRGKAAISRAAKADTPKDPYADVAVDGTEPGAALDDVPTEDIEAQPAKRGRRKRDTSQRPQAEESVLATEETDAKFPAKKAAARKRTAKKAQKDESSLESRPDLDAESSMISVKADSKPKRGRKRTSDGEEKLDSSVVVVDEKPTEPAKSKAKRTTAKKQPDPEPVSETAAAQDESQAEEPVEEVKARPTQKKATERKKAPAKKQTKAKEPEPEPAEGEAEATAVYVDENQGDAGPLDSPPRRAPKPTEVMSPSAQSSDAENVPPSSRPPTVERPRHAPLSPTTINVQTPRTSPSKRKPIGGLVSSMPWNGMDLENILLPSPGSGQAWNAGQMKLDDVLAHLESPEKRMTVEEWIVHNASQAEGRLRSECEKMIVKFENEGNRALRAVEGIDCGM